MAAQESAECALSEDIDALLLLLLFVLLDVKLLEHVEHFDLSGFKFIVLPRFGGLLDAVGILFFLLLPFSIEKLSGLLNLDFLLVGDLLKDVLALVASERVVEHFLLLLDVATHDPKLELLTLGRVDSWQICLVKSELDRIRDFLEAFLTCCHPQLSLRSLEFHLLETGVVPRCSLECCDGVLHRTFQEGITSDIR